METAFGAPYYTIRRSDLASCLAAAIPVERYIGHTVSHVAKITAIASRRVQPRVGFGRCPYRSGRNHSAVGVLCSVPKNLGSLAAWLIAAWSGRIA